MNAPELRPYQVQAVEEARSKFRGGAKRVLVTMPTGGGKTVLASEIIRSAVAKGSRALFLAHRRELITQSCDKLIRFGVQPGVIMGTAAKALHRPVQVASVQTLVRHRELLSAVDLIFLDEAHHATTTNSYGAILGWFPNAKVVGLTATPWRLDGRGLGDVFDGHVLACTPAELRDQGFLAPVGGWEYEAIDTTQARVKNGDFVSGDLRASASSSRVVGDVVTEWLAHAGGGRTVLFAIDVEHSRLMVEAFRKEGVAAEHIDGAMPAEERDAVLARLRAGTTRLVSNCNVLTEGFDCPEIECVILARPTLSGSLFLQMVGRGLRISPGKAMARIHDHAGCLAAHGHPYAERDYSPEKTDRVNRKKVESSEVRHRRCPACKSILARIPCDACGYTEGAAPQVQLFDEAAVRREISADGTAPTKKRSTPSEMADQWKRFFAANEQAQFAKLEKFIRKHGPKEGARIYRWYSGFTASPPREWVDEISARLSREAQQEELVAG